MRRVHHLRVEHQAVVLALLVLDDRERRVGRNARDLEAGRHLGDAVAVAHPHRIVLAGTPHVVEQAALGFHLHIGAAELAMMPALDRAAELRRHGHLAVADAEHRHARVEDLLRRARGARLVHGFRPAREDDAVRLHRVEGFFGFLERHDLGIDPLLADAPRDQLGDLGAEIDDQNLVVRHCEQLANCTGARNGAEKRPTAIRRRRPRRR